MIGSIRAGLADSAALSKAIRAAASNASFVAVGLVLWRVQQRDLHVDHRVAGQHAGLGRIRDRRLRPPSRTPAGRSRAATWFAKATCSSPGGGVYGSTRSLTLA